MAEKEVQLQIQAQEVMNEFCWAYANALFQKLKELKKQKRIPKDYRDNKMALQIVDELRRQLGGPPENSDAKFIDDTISYTEEFLAIFEKK